MKVHPVATKRNITARYDDDSQTSETTSETLMDGTAQKKLRRLPHIFSKVLELPFRSDADVAVEESSDCFRFVAEIDDAIGDGVRAHAVEIHPGVIKVVVRGGGGNNGEEVELLINKLEVDAWRFRLPASTRPELATAVFVDGELIVTVPKGGGEFNGGEIWGGVGRLVLVQ
uniref:SHSP domain-containing protein n=1 Tax=Davidia involucrata TaxID=16924 RepID=A0A5B6ZF95_DAVIN